MPRINLLPWREAERRERKLHFMVALGGSSVVAGVFTFIAYLLFSSMVSAQQARNDLLRGDIKVLDRQIAQINNLESEKRRFIARMEVIEKLQRSRPEIVHLFDTIVRVVPQGVYLTSITQQGAHIKFTGVAQSSTRVSVFMRNIDSSRWLTKPALEVIRARSNNSLSSTFALDAQVVSPKENGAGVQTGDGPVQRVARAGG